jgi:integral membrane protein
MTPLRVFRFFAVIEALTWLGLLAGMFVKYVPQSTEAGVQVMGPVHGVAFIAYCLVTVLVSIDQGWSRGRTLLGLFSAVPPLMTIWFDRYAERRGALDDRWHSTQDSPTAAQRAVCWFLRHWQVAGVSFVAAVAALTGVALIAGPPVG